MHTMIEETRQQLYAGTVERAGLTRLNQDALAYASRNLQDMADDRIGTDLDRVARKAGDFLRALQGNE